MSLTRKNNQYIFGMKAHIGVDAYSGLVHCSLTTTAKESDRSMLYELLHEKAVFGDKGYVSDVDKHFAKDAGIYWGI